ncbi:MAG: hypothetical protein A2Y34_09490 [Spirochaetes bacterium GWC1_27_15]|nr:MAG: hypothetical protein A2Z98_09560 [Spirochaetes bacterium GWB1_27_13]OHD21655.1 MAG: hypothetical protein A2Y34_09490 [Spirochaetes bacterium GWC1_27_15]
MARDLNHIIIIGRLVRQPEIKYTTSGVPVTKFSIANNVSYGQGNEKKEIVNYFDINVWGNQAVSCEKYLKKGSQVAIEGQLRQNRWVDQATGKNQSKVEIVANSVQFLTQATSQGGGENYQPSTQNFQNTQQNTQNTQNYPTKSGGTEHKDFIPNPWNDNSDNGFDDSNFLPDKDDDIPF